MTLHNHPTALATLTYKYVHASAACVSFCPQALWHILYHNEDMEYALSAARLHHQLSPNEVRLERHMPQVHTWD